MDPNALVQSMRDMLVKRDPLSWGLLKAYLADYDQWRRMGGFPADLEVTK